MWVIPDQTDPPIGCSGFAEDLSPALKPLGKKRTRNPAIANIAAPTMRRFADPTSRT